MKNPLLYLFFASSLLIVSCESENASSVEKIEAIADQESEVDYLAEGQNIVNQAQATLGRNLMQAINTGGSEFAVEFCSTKAIQLTDNVGNSMNATVKRVSDNNRNSGNAANAEELQYIEKAKATLAFGKQPSGSMRNVGNRMVAYYPIISNVMCMQCHGEPNTEISPETLAKINTLYPNDRATGYKPNELRGIWVVEMDKNNK